MKVKVGKKCPVKKLKKGVWLHLPRINKRKYSSRKRNVLLGQKLVAAVKWARISYYIRLASSKGNLDLQEQDLITFQLRNHKPRRACRGHSSGRIKPDMHHPGAGNDQWGINWAKQESLLPCNVNATSLTCGGCGKQFKLILFLYLTDFNFFSGGKRGL